MLAGSDPDLFATKNPLRRVFCWLGAKRRQLQKQLGAAASGLFSHCATRGARHEISQRLPLCSVLQVLVPSRVELVVVVLVPPTLELVVELDTLLEVLEVLELLEFTEFVELVTLDAACVVGMFPPGPQAESASASAVTRYLIGALHVH